MYLSPIETLIIIVVIVFATLLIRFSPFFLFPENKEVPEFITYLGKCLPPAMMGLLVVYCLRNTVVTSMPFGLPELLAVSFIVIVHKWKNNFLLSLGGSTLLYMFLVQSIF